MVGGMGHTISVAQGLRLKEKKNVICIDGDGSLIMHLGSLLSVSSFKKNFKYILINNKVHESVGGQETNIQNLKIKKLAEAFKFNQYLSCDAKSDVNQKVKYFLKKNTSIFFEVKTQIGTYEKLSRPKNFKLIKKNLSL